MRLRAITVIAAMLPFVGYGILDTFAADANADAIPPLLRAIKLIKLDPALGTAIIRNDDGQYLTLRGGDMLAEKSIRVVRLYADRIELQAVAPIDGVKHRYWLAVGATSVQRITDRPAEASYSQSIETHVVPISGRPAK